MTESELPSCVKNCNFVIKSFRSTVLLCGALLGLSACSHSAQIAEHAGHYNDTLAIVEDEMMLKNILRAAERRKMHFTRLQSFTGSLSSSASLTSNLRAGADGATEAFFNPLTLEASSSPSYSLSALNSKEFFNGILSPVPPSTFDLFINQGWSFDVLLSIFVDSIEVKSKNEGTLSITCVIKNDPLNDMRRYAEFVKVAANFVEKEVRDKKEKPYGPAMPAKEIRNGVQLAALKNTGLDLKKLDSGEYQLHSTTKSEAYKIDTVKYPADILVNLNDQDDPCSVENISTLTSPGYEIDQNRDIENQELIELEVSAKLRSAQAMIFFLGELSRYDLRNLESGEKSIHNVGANKYWNVAGGSQVNSVLSASVRGIGSIHIPSNHDFTDSTLRMLTLVQQVFDLNTASDKAAAVTPVIRLVN